MKATRINIRKRQITELCGELKYAVRTSRERLPLVEKKIDELMEEQNRQKRLISEIQQKFDMEKSSLNQEQGVVNDRLKRLKKRKEYYSAQKIEEILKRYEQDFERSCAISVMEIHCPLLARMVRKTCLRPFTLSIIHA